MAKFTAATAVLLTVCLLNACTDHTILAPPKNADRLASDCARSSAHVVASEAELDAAVASAQPGDVIAIQGTIELTQDVSVTTSDVTFTCATTDAALTGGSTGMYALIKIFAPRVAVRGLTLTPRNQVMALYAARVLGYTNADALDIEDNTIHCAGACTLLAGPSHSLIRNNRLDGVANLSGIHVQAGGPGTSIDGTRIDHNTVIQAGSSIAASALGGIRVRDGADVIVSDNTIQGPWSNGIAATNVSNSSFERNHISGAIDYGVLLGGIRTGRTINNLNNQLRANQISASGLAGMMIRDACSNAFAGNSFSDNNGVAAVFDVDTGANGFAGNSEAVFDNGAADCDHDGHVDANRITGVNSVSHGGPFASFEGSFAGSPTGKTSLQ